MTETLMQLVGTFGALDAVLMVGVGLIWREWRKVDRELKEHLQNTMQVHVDLLTKYNNFENAIKAMTELLRKG